MVINDEADILMLYSDYFSNRGHQVLKAYLTAALKEKGQICT
jgi:hypothetical protein